MSARAKPPAFRAGFGPHCILRPSGPPHNRLFTAQWKDRPWLNRDGTTHYTPSETHARAWLAAADVTNGATARPV